MIKIAVISGSRGTREFLRQGLSVFSGIEFVYGGQSLSRHFRGLAEAHPNIILVDVGSPNTFSDEIKPDFPKIHKSLPETKVLIRTDLPETAEFVRRAVDSGASIIDSRLGISRIVEAMTTISDGRDVIWYAGREHDLESHEPPGWRLFTRGSSRKES